jgi:hypothetical protein
MQESLGKIQYHFKLKALKKLVIREIYFDKMNAIYDKHRANIILNREKLKSFPLKLGMREVC